MVHRSEVNTSHFYLFLCAGAEPISLIQAWMVYFEEQLETQHGGPKEERVTCEYTYMIRCQLADMTWSEKESHT